MPPVFASRDYRLLWLGQTVALLGDQFHLIALPWLVLQLTRDPLQLGLVLAVAGLSRAVFLLLGGALADRWSPREIMIWCNAVRGGVAGALAVVVLGGAVEMWMVHLAALSFGILTGLFEPASQAAVPRLVRDEHLESGNSLVMFGDQLASFLGPTAAGLLIGGFAAPPGAAEGSAAMAGLGAAFVVHAASFALSLALLSRMGRLAAGSPGVREPPLRSIAGGLRYVAARPGLGRLLVIVALTNFFIVGPIFVGVPVLADTRLAGGAAALGAVLSGYALGNLGGLGLAVVVKRPSPRVLGAIVLGLFAMFAGGLTSFAGVEQTFTAVAVMALMGIGNGFLGVVIVTTLQRSAPPEMLGRVMSLLMLATFATMPASQALAGAALKLGSEAMFLGAAAGMALTGLLAVSRPETRTLGAARLPPREPELPTGSLASTG